MEEEFAIITENTRKEKIKIFFSKNKKKIYFLIAISLVSIFSVFFYFNKVSEQRVAIANKFINISLSYEDGNKEHFFKKFIEIIDTNDSTYAPLSLFFLIDNQIVDSKEKINELFDKILNNSNLEKEVKYLLIYKKALLNADQESENNMIEILKPIINSDSVWKSHALLLLGDYFFFKDEKQKAKDFYSQILTLQKNNKNIFNQAQMRIRKNYVE